MTTYLYFSISQHRICYLKINERNNAITVTAITPTLVALINSCWLAKSSGVKNVFALIRFTTE